ncbi:efflux RND transporter periplasmic adaptor subunit [Leptolyngbya sp. PCC 6406]|uniref:efflux RND transporter periplasmic adaptor subunit n=1 Tax=Leptolyngbya sp. PCC 6406 TaxID=1173264 RepID=UPI0002ACD5BA|nr:efflux RND transporter periplasmic adaptor subunit [Leptolyngbya sp. PCC 6406]
MTSQDISSPPLQTVVSKDQPSGPSRWIWIGGLGLILLGGGFVGWQVLAPRLGGPPMQMQMPPGVPVTLATVQGGQIQDSSTFIGSLEAQSGATLQPEVAGRVTQVYVSAGDRVAAGTPIVLISPDRTQAEANAAQSNVIASQAARESAAARLRSLQARQLEVEAELSLQEEEYRRTAYLVEEGALSQQSLDLANRNRDVARAAIAAARQEIAASQASLNQADASLGQAEASRAAAQQTLQDRTVVAPIDGIVGNVGPKLGDYVAPGTVITTITENATLELDLEIPIEQRDRITLGLPVELLAAGSDQVIAQGSVTFISPQTNASTQTVLTKARFTNANGRLQDAQRLDARIIWSRQPGVLVPTSAITRLGNQTFVYIADEGTPEELPPPEALPPGMPPITQVARLRPVTLGDIQGNNYQVLEGLQPGETIVVAGILNLQDGTPILPQGGDGNGESPGDSQGGF